MVFNFIMLMKELSCRYSDWYDPEMCERPKKIIPGLLMNKR